MPLQFKFDWKNPDYRVVYEWRLEKLKKIRANPSILPALKAYYRDNPAQLIIDFGNTYDPRLVRRGLPAVLPFLLFPKQEELAYWIVDRWKAGEPGLIEKSRDMGITWLVMSLACVMCLLNREMAIGTGSRKEALVDVLGDPDSMLEKARLFMSGLPREFRGGWDRNDKTCSAHMRIRFPETDSIITGEAGDAIGRGGRKSIYMVDEAQPLNARILTPHGWTTMGEIQIGCEVIGSDGKPTAVTNINDCGEHEVYRIEFSDGSSTLASHNHRWVFDKVWGKKERVELRTHELVQKFAYDSPGGQRQYLYRVPLVQPVEFEQIDDLPLDPYVLGCLLGDGNITESTPRITTADDELLREVERRLPDGVKIGSHDGKYSWRLVDEEGRKRSGFQVIKSSLWLAIDAAGLKRVCAPDKYVPKKYLKASTAIRLEVLQGLMDTDGHAQKNGGASFHTSSARLAEDVCFIARSLGGMAYHKIKSDARGYLDQHCIQIVLPNDQSPFLLTRKMDRLQSRKNKMSRVVTNVVPVGRQTVRCITVASPDGLYVTDDFVITHNSAHLERPHLIDASLSANTDCRIDLSSVKGMANPFAAKRFGGKIAVFSFHHTDDPRKGPEWYAQQVHNLDPITLAQEVDMSYTASVEGVVIPNDWIRASVDAARKLGITPTGARRGALDVADEGTDKNAFCGAHGIEVQTVEEWSGLGSDIFKTTERAFILCDTGEYEDVKYDADGLGAGVRGDANVINERRKQQSQRPINASAFRGSAAVVDPEKEDVKSRKNEDYFANLKAQSWWRLRIRFQKTYRAVVEGHEFDADEIISLSPQITNLQKLITELSQPTWSLNGAGKILIDKAPDGVKSPNLADSVMIQFAPGERQPIKVGAHMLANLNRM